MRVKVANGGTISVVDWKDAIRVACGEKPRVRETVEIAPGVKRRVK